MKTKFFKILAPIVALGLLEQDTTNGTYAISANNEITSNIYLYEFSFKADGSIDVEDKIAANTNGQTELMSLAQNTPTQLSVLVYLDGDVVDNSMVSAEEVASLQGSLNLQFSSSADLKPMDYAEFKDTTNNGATTETTTEASGN